MPKLKSQIFARRLVDQTGVERVAIVAQRTSHSFWQWFEDHHIDSLAVIVVTLAMTVRVVEWALDFPYDTVTKLSGVDKAAILGAVLTPWGIMQGFMFKLYVDLKSKNGHTVAQ
jgi:hypothetical protein